ncbi:MAG: hypothetical protein DMG25_01960 [Acidobacteria bacterium]|nr:MAG: hypothetical protein DMG25_01960 [Acidobacteriota bacterium]PYV20985.1 MAG: hypothetical protein DMG27_21810 [Acidobacteriota bacterium]
MNYYDCHWDSSVWLRSLGVMGLLAAIYAFLVWSRHGRTDMLAWGAVLLLPLLVALAFAPRGYEVTDRTLTVRMVACLARYNLADLRRAEIATPGEAFGFPTLRMFGVGGLFGYCGRFKNARLGSFVAFVTDKQKLVVLRFSTKTLVVSPDLPADFVQRVGAAARG